jgi:quercetin dioxygenase-like cupin family protein
LNAEFSGFAGHALISRHDFAEPWPSWERHPKGDEFVYLLEGDLDFILWVDGAEQTFRVNEPDSYVVVPKNIWHTVRPRKPTVMLFVTPGESTEHADTPPG